jgi:hypothetical protein
MKRANSREGERVADLDLLIAEITTDAYGDDEQLWSFLQALQDGVEFPSDAFVIGEPVSVVAFDYDGNQRRGLVARCRREDGSEHVVAASELVLAPRASGGQFLAAYCKWLGLDPLPEQIAASTRRMRQHKVAPTDLDLSHPIDLVVLSVSKIDNHKQEPWKLPLPQFIEELYLKRFGKTALDAMMSIEERAHIEQQKKEGRPT